MEKMYRSKYEAYSFLSDKPNDLRCDFELLTDELASFTGFLQSQTDNNDIKADLGFICNMIYHINPSLRTFTSITPQELEKLEQMVKHLQKHITSPTKGFVLPMGCKNAALAHVLRAKSKAVVRLLYCHAYQGHKVDEILLDFTNLLSGYFFFLALRFNVIAGVCEVVYASRNYMN